MIQIKVASSTAAQKVGACHFSQDIFSQDIFFNIEAAATATIVLSVALIVYVLLSIWGTIMEFPD